MGGGGFCGEFWSFWLGVLLLDLINWYVWTRLIDQYIGLALPAICQFLFSSNSNVTYEDGFSGMQYSRTPDSQVIMPFMLGSALLFRFLSFLYAKQSLSWSFPAKSVWFVADIESGDGPKQRLWLILDVSQTSESRVNNQWCHGRLRYTPDLEWVHAPSSHSSGIPPGCPASSEVSE